MLSRFSVTRIATIRSALLRTPTITTMRRFTSSDGGSPCGTACPTPAACGIDTPPVRDIAHKPNNSGWGYNPKYAESFDAIFKRNKLQQDGGSAHDTPSTSASNKQ